MERNLEGGKTNLKGREREFHTNSMKSLQGMTILHEGENNLILKRERMAIYLIVAVALGCYECAYT